MNYFGKFDATASDALGQHPSARLFSESVHATHVPPDAVVVSDAQLLFNAEFKRAGADLVLSGEGREVVLHDYFKGQTRAPIASPDGAHLTGDIVTALAGEVQLAQADGSAGAHTVIGHVTKLVGSATATRNGVSIILNNGDNVEKGDVVASGSDSTVGITFIDGTVFGLSSNARMVLNEMVYDPNGSNNSSLLSLVAGTITFVAGETAKHGDMKVDTPVATMGIRGTAVLVEIDFAVPGTTPDAKFQVLVEPDGTTGSYILFDKQTLTPLAVVDQAGHQINISNGVLSQTLVPLSPEIQKLISDVFSLKFSDSSTTKSIEHFTDTIVPTDAFGPIKITGLTPNLLIPVTITSLDLDTPNITPVIPPIPPHLPNVLHIATTNGIIVERAGAAGAGPDTISGTVNFVDGNPFDRPTVSTQFSSLSLHNAQGQDISGTLTAQQLSAVEAALTLTANPGNNNNGGYTWTYSVPASALSFLTAGETLTLTYNATVNNNFGPADETVSAPITITIKVSGEIWSETKEIASPSPGDWSNGANWQTGVAPTASDDVIIVTDPAQSGTPFYPVTIKSAEAGGVPASADSVIMNDLGEIPPELDNYNTGDPEAGVAGLTIGSGGLHMNADSILRNFGTISIGGLAEILQHSVLQNSGTLTLKQGGDFNDSSQIINSGTIEIAGDPLHPLNVRVNIDNDGGTLQIDDNAAMMLAEGATVENGFIELGINSVLHVESTEGATLDDVTVTSDVFGAIDIGVNTTGGSILTLKDGTSITGGSMTIAADSTLDVESEGGATLDFVTVTANLTGTIEIGLHTEGGSILTLKDATSIAGGNMTIAADSKLDVESEGGAALDGVTVTGTSGELSSTIEIGVNTEGGSILTLLDGTTITNGDMTLASGSTLDIEAGTTGPGATLDGVTVTGTSDPSTIEVGTLGAATLLLKGGTTITSGNLTIAGGSTLDVEGRASPLSPSATLDDVTVTNDATGTIDVGINTPPRLPFNPLLPEGAVLVLEGGTTITGGSLKVAIGSTLDVQGADGATLDGVSVMGFGAGTGVQSAIAIDSEYPAVDTPVLTLEDGTAVKNINLWIDPGSTLDVESAKGATLDGVDVFDLSVAGSPARIAIGAHTASGSMLTLEDGTTVSEIIGEGANGSIAISSGSVLDIESAAGASINDIAITGTNGPAASTIEVGAHTASGSILTLQDGTTITNGDMTIAAGSTLDVEGTVAGGPTATLDGVTVTGVNATDAALASTIEIGMTGAATLLLDDGTTVTNGALKIGAGSTLDIESSKGATLEGVDVTNDGTIQVDGPIGSPEIVNLLLDGGTTISGGKLLINALQNGIEGTVEIGAGGATFDDVAVTNNILTVDGAATLTIDGGTTINGGTIEDAGTIAGFGTISSVITGPGALTASGGTLTLTGDNTYSGLTTIDGGSTLALSGTGSIANSSDVIDDGTFDVSGLTAGTSITTLSGTGKVNLGANTLTLTAGAGSFSGVISGSGGLTVDGTGAETLSGINTYSGATSIGSGETLTLSGSGSIAASSGVADDGTFDISTTTSGASIVTLSGKGAVKLGSKTLTLSNASTTFSGTIGGTGGLTLLAGMLILTGDSNYSGTTTISGTLALSGLGSIADSGNVIDHGTFDISGLTTGGTSIVTLSGDGTVKLGSETLTLSDASTTFSGTIGGAGGLTLTTGTETLTGNNNYSGTTTINGGTLALSGSGSIASSNGVVDIGSFDISGLTAGTSITTLSGTGKVILGNNTLTLTAGAGTFSGVISGSGGLTVDGTGTETLSGINTYTGATTIGSGETLALSGTGSIAKSSGVADNGTFDISKTSAGASIVTLSGNGALKLGSETLTLSHASTAFNGTISSTGGGITVAGGTLTLGTMTLDDLTLAGSFSNAGTLTVNHTVTLNGASIDGGTLDISGILDSTGTSTISDATIINPGHIDVVGGTLTIDPTPFTNTGTFEVQSSAVFSGEVVTDSHGHVISVLQEVVTNTNGTIQIDQGGTLTLFDTTINGGQIIDNGTLLITGTTSKLENVTLDIGSNTSLELGGSDFSGVTVNFGVPGQHGNLVVSTGGLLILDDSHHFEGTITGLVENSDEGLENHVDLTDLHYDTSKSAHQHVSATYSGGEVTVTVTQESDHHVLVLDQVSLAVSGQTTGSFEASSDGNGGVLLDDPPTTGNVTINSDQTLSISAASSNTVTFTNNGGTTGELLLVDSHEFTGTISGFAGDGTVDNSDLIDVADVNFANVATDKTTYTENADGTGTLTLHDANGQVLDSINFTGNYQLANFTIENDGNGGTLIVDPPVNNSSPTPSNTVVASGPNQVLSGSAPADNFVFNFAAVGHSAISNFDPAADTIQFSSSVFANVQSILNAVHDDGHGNSVIAIDAHDSITLNGVPKAQLHANDFHVI